MRAAVVALPRRAGQGFGGATASAEVDGAVISCWHVMAASMLLCRQLEHCPALQCLHTCGTAVGIGDSLAQEQGCLPGGPWAQDRLLAVRSSRPSALVVSV